MKLFVLSGLALALAGAAEGPVLYPVRKTNGVFQVWWQPTVQGTSYVQWSTNGLTWTNASNESRVTTTNGNWAYTSTCLRCNEMIFYRVLIYPTVP